MPSGPTAETANRENMRSTSFVDGVHLGGGCRGAAALRRQALDRLATVPAPSSSPLIAPSILTADFAHLADEIAS
ncbi:MAG: hypothetical protein ABJD68_16445, partial [Nakamurella sp.]